LVVNGDVVVKDTLSAKSIEVLPGAKTDPTSSGSEGKLAEATKKLQESVEKVLAEVEELHLAYELTGQPGQSDTVYFDRSARGNTKYR
jgi:hypothetical protein